jgi:cobalt-zinc-cadmium efflux system membrane fusion protein
MTTNVKVVLVLLLVLVGGATACAEDKDHDHEHAVAPTTKPAHVHGDDHDHDHDAPAATTQGAAKDDHGDQGDDHGHGHGHGHGHADEVKLTAEAIRVAKIRVEPVKTHPLSATFTAPARVAFNGEAMAHVGSLVPGRVVDIKARVGDVVKKGDVLLVVESTELGQAQSDYLQKRSDLAVAVAAVEPAKQSFDRARKLYDQSQGIALGEVQKRQADLKAAEGSALTAKAAVVAALNRLLLLGMSKEEAAELEDKGILKPELSVRAPISGRVIEREVTLGELVAPEKERLLVLADTETVWVLADVSESRLGQISTGSPAQVRITALPDQPLEAKVAQIAPALNPDTRAGRVRVEVANGNGSLRPGMFASVVLTAGAAGGAAVLAIPDEAVQTIGGGPAVFVPVEGEQNTFAKRAVTLGPGVGGMVPVVSGLKEGEPVVVSGTFILKAELGKGAASHQH